MSMYLCILIYAHKSQHFVEAHFRHKHETGKLGTHTAHILRYGNVKISLKNANFNQAQTPIPPPLPQIPYPAAYRRLQAEVERPQAGRLHFSLPTFWWQPKLHYVQVVCE